MTPTFVAIDFETADHGADSACAVGLVRVEDWAIVARESRLIRPPRRYIRFTYIHGITWAEVEGAPIFAKIWPQYICKPKFSIGKLPQHKITNTLLSTRANKKIRIRKIME